MKMVTQNLILANPFIQMQGLPGQPEQYTREEGRERER
jgi:hypothetical protein